MICQPNRPDLRALGSDRTGCLATNLVSPDRDIGIGDLLRIVYPGAVGRLKGTYPIRDILGEYGLPGNPRHCTSRPPWPLPNGLLLVPSDPRLLWSACAEAPPARSHLWVRHYTLGLPRPKFMERHAD